MRQYIKLDMNNIRSKKSFKILRLDNFFKNNNENIDDNNTDNNNDSNNNKNTDNNTDNNNYNDITTDNNTDNNNDNDINTDNDSNTDSDNNDNNYSFKNLFINNLEDDDTTYVYTDGACTNNGKKNAKAGLGVYFKENDNRNLSQIVKGKQTNNVAELSAIIEAFYILEAEIKDKNKIVICSDSQISIGWCTTTGRKYESWGWKKKMELFLILN